MIERIISSGRNVLLIMIVIMFVHIITSKNVREVKKVTEHNSKRLPHQLQ